jgi:oxygen-independent coproporphyrinogen-3 oxidase
MEDWQEGGFGLYLHWPFCASKCPYCDFNSHVAAAVDEDRWRRAYLAEIARIGAETGPRVLNTVFFGGGTPSLMSPSLVAAVLEAVRATWPMANDAEITLEANPGSVEAGRFRGYRDAGVSRVSMGMQAMNDADLRRLGRLHTAAEARAAFEVARGVFDRVSFDLIYARQDQAAEDWRAELRAALALAMDHLSLYQLTIEEGTAFAARAAAGGLKGLPDEDRAADLWEITQEECGRAGMPGYEVSNHARPGAESRHNLVYWRSGDWAGIGPGAHGRLTLAGTRFATDTPRAPGAWLEAVEKTGSGEGARVALPLKERAAEYVMMGLRLTEGIDLNRLSRIDPEALDVNNINDLAEVGLVESRAGRLRATARGRPVLNALLRAVLA